MKASLARAFKRHEIYVVATMIGVVFVAAMGIVAWVVRGSVTAPPYEALSEQDLACVYATAYLRHREDDGSPYLKVEVHNGTLWWIKKVEFEFDGRLYILNDAEAFRPLYFGAARCPLKKDPPFTETREYDLKILNASGYPPAEVQWNRNSRSIAQGSVGR